MMGEAPCMTIGKNRKSRVPGRAALGRSEPPSSLPWEPLRSRQIRGALAASLGTLRPETLAAFLTQCVTIPFLRSPIQRRKLIDGRITLGQHSSTR